MTDTDHPRFVALLAILAETFGETVTPPRLEGYWLALRDLPLEAVEWAVKLALIRSRFFPRPAELRELSGAGGPDAGLVEALLVAHLRQPGGERRLPSDAFLRLVVERLGGLYACAGMASAIRLRTLERMLPALITAATLRGLPLPTEVALSGPRPVLLAHRAEPSNGAPPLGGEE